jgi:excisionase family DNA binding protein
LLTHVEHPHPEIPNASERTWITVPEAAEELHIPRTRCYELIQRGELPAVRIGERSIRVNRAELERFLLETRRVVAGAVEVKATPARAAKEAVGK